VLARSDEDDSAVDRGTFVGPFTDGLAVPFAAKPSTKERTSMDILLIILIGLIAGALAGRVVTGDGYGALGDIVVGVVGALLGGWVLLRVFGIVAGGLIGSLVTAFIGAVILLWLIRLVAPSRA
jgi:uncharacterized membrane protein YeaQ/YmgE (transglycosylase-associated protein family)